MSREEASRGHPPPARNARRRPSNGMKILLLCEGDAETRDSWSGVTRSVVSHLRARGHDVIPGDVDLYGAPRWMNAFRTLSPSPRRWRMRYRLHGPSFRARSRIAEQHLAGAPDDIDLILQVGATFRIADPGARPLVLYCDSNIELSRSGAPTGYSEAAFLAPGEIEAIREREASVYRRADLIFTMSDFLRDSFIQDFQVAPERLVTLHCGPNITLDETPSTPPIRDPEPTILFVGRDFHRKGGDLLLDAFQRVRRRLPGARLLMVGPGERPRVPDGVRIWGFQDPDTPEGRTAMDHAYRSARVFCLPTRFEPFGTSFIEAMAYHLPCVGPRAWAVPEIIQDGETGFLVPSEDPAALAEALVRLLSDETLTLRMGQAARRRTLERFTWPAIISRMEASLTATFRDRSGPEGDRSRSA
jgi:alpha-maltose-1-phosphate synthase